MTLPPPGPARNIAIFPWQRFLQSLLFWQAIWFLYFQGALSASEAILLYAISDLTTTVLEVPSGYFSDRLGRRLTLLISAACMASGAAAFAVGGAFWVFVTAQVLLGAGGAFLSGTDSSLLYESLVAEGRENEVEAQELRAWRFSFSALAISALIGGALALVSFPLVYWATAVAMLGALLLALAFREPPHETSGPASEFQRMTEMVRQLRNPILGWLFALGIVMYGFSHLPFIFGQPFILNAVTDLGLTAEAPLISGAVTCVMMLVSVGTSLLAGWLKGRIGMRAMLLFAFGIQIALPFALTLSASAVLIALLVLRMVPDSLSKPFITARIMPLLTSDSRATFLSLKSLIGRVLFAASLIALSGKGGTGEMSYDAIQSLLGIYVIAGVAIWIVLALTSRRVVMEAETP